MPTPSSRAHADLFRRLDDMPIPAHERELAKSQARIAFRLVDALFDVAGGVRAGVLAMRRDPRRPQRAH